VGPENLNHHHVAAINDALKARRGVKTWFDSERMKDNIVEQMCDGIENSQLAIVFVTQRHLDKAALGDGRDNCKREFLHCMEILTSTNMVACLMEKDVRKPWVGPVGMALGSALYVNMSHTDPTENIEELCERLRRKGLHIRSGPARRQASCKTLPVTMDPIFLGGPGVLLADKLHHHHNMTGRGQHKSLRAVLLAALLLD
jgi:hypothetical protein